MYQVIAKLQAVKTKNTEEFTVCVGEEDVDDLVPEPYKVWVPGGLLSTGEEDCYFQTLDAAMSFAGREIQIHLYESIM